jgi:hypothetical protein
VARNKPEISPNNDTNGWWAIQVAKQVLDVIGANLALEAQHLQN